jgi:hypothetical protein
VDFRGISVHTIYAAIIKPVNRRLPDSVVHRQLNIDLTGWQAEDGMELVFPTHSNARRRGGIGMGIPREWRRCWRMGNALNFFDLEER